MRTKAIVVPLLTGLAVALVAYAQELKSADGIFNFSTAKMTSYKTWSGDIVQTMNMFGSEVATKGSITQKQPRKMRMQTDMPMMGQQMKMVLGDDGMYVAGNGDAGRQAGYQNGHGQSSKQRDGPDRNKSRSTQGHGPEPAMGGQQGNDGFRRKGHRDLHGEPMYVVEGAWKQDALTNKQVAAMAGLLGKTVICIGQKDGFVHRYEQYAKTSTNMIMSMEFSNLKFNEDIPDDSFKYQPPPGVPVMDMAQMGVGAAGGRPSQPVIPPPPPIPPRQCPTQRLTTFGSHCRKVVASRIHLISERFLACCHLLGVTSGNLSTVE
jgi:outer membrane lipoprotein-sorting protein